MLNDPILFHKIQVVSQPTSTNSRSYSGPAHCLLCPTLTAKLRTGIRQLWTPKISLLLNNNWVASNNMKLRTFFVQMRWILSPNNQVKLQFRTRWWKKLEWPRQGLVWTIRQWWGMAGPWRQKQPEPNWETELLERAAGAWREGPRQPGLGGDCASRDWWQRQGKQGKMGWEQKSNQRSNRWRTPFCKKDIQVVSANCTKEICNLSGPISLPFSVAKYKGNTNPPPLPKPALTEEEVARKSTAIIEEYLHINDLKVHECYFAKHTSSGFAGLI